MPTLLLTDNPFALDLSRALEARYGGIQVFQSPGGALPNVPALNVKSEVERIIREFDLVVSIHCKQFFPPALVNGVRCINVHPGLNPHNRGWYPQVFSILNGLPAGVTIHEMDTELDHGPIIVQQALELHPWDTSGSAYTRLMALEREMVLEHFGRIREQGRVTSAPPPEGNLNTKRDFDALRELDLSAATTYGAVIDHLRALTHEPYANAYFRTPEGRKVFVKLQLEPEPSAPEADPGSRSEGKET